MFATNYERIHRRLVKSIGGEAGGNLSVSLTVAEITRKTVFREITRGKETG